LRRLQLALLGRRTSTRRPSIGRRAFPGELPETPVVPEVLSIDEILVDGQVVNLIHVGQGDVEGSTIFDVPSADAVVCGDVVYNIVYMMLYVYDEEKREARTVRIV